MLGTATNKAITSSSRVHIDLVDEFIRLTQDRIGAQKDIFVRESLNDLLASLREERAGYMELLSAASQFKAA